MDVQAKKDSTHKEAGAAFGVADADSPRVNATCFRQVLSGSLERIDPYTGHDQARVMI